MSRHYQAEKRLAVVMAVYEPGEEWLREQLFSLNQQTMKGFVLLVRDDHSPTFPYERLQQLLAQCMTHVPYTCARNERNMGSNATFGLLTKEADCDWIAYCDQDDIWEPDKLEKLAIALNKTGNTLSYCDLSVVNRQGQKTHQSLTQAKPGIVYQEGEGLAPTFLTTNFITGCALMIDAAIAKAALPFLSHIVYDQWLGMWAAHQGRIIYVPERLVRHRIHNANQTLTLGNIHTKQDYYERQTMGFEARMKELQGRIALGEAQTAAEDWASARVSLMRRERGAWRRLYRLRRVNQRITLFELALPLMPQAVFSLAISLAKEGRI